MTGEQVHGLIIIYLYAAAILALLVTASLYVAATRERHQRRNQR